METRQDRAAARWQCHCTERKWRTGERAGRGEPSLRSRPLRAVAAVLAMAVLAGCDTGSRGSSGPGEFAAVLPNDSPEVREAGARVALVIGNAAYESSAVGRLNNPVRDAKAVAEVLRKVDFEVMEGKDLKESGFHEVLDEFGELSLKAEAAVFYYAGHGMAKNGVNYMIPVDMEDETKTHDAIELGEVTGAMGGAYNLVFLDACRTPPRSRVRPKNRGRAEDDRSALSRGLVAVRVDEETRGGEIRFSYAAEPGTAAEDGEPEGNSPYAAALAEHIGKPGQRLQDLLRKVEVAVSTETEGRQRTWTDGRPGPPFYFVPPVDGGDDPIPGTDAWRKDLEVMRGSRSVAVVEEYIRKYENLPAAELAVKEARELLTKLTEPVFSEIGMEFVWIPAGTFMMGSPEGEAGRHDDERQHEVRISRGYWMGKYEVTQGEWEEVMGSNPSRFKECGSRCPVENVSWEDAQEFVRKLNGRESGRGYRYRLPSEAEWEYAVRAGTSGATPEGELRILGKRNAPELDGQAWYGGNCGVSYLGAWDCSGWEEKQDESEWCGTHPVGHKGANGWGLHDMLGNVWEWTADWYEEYPSRSVTDPKGPGTDSHRVARGGGWGNNATALRSADRGRTKPGDRNANLGFRLVRTE